MKLNKTLAVTLVLLTAMVSLSASGAAVASDDSDNSTVTVTVATKIAVDISPSELSYSSITPGSTATTSSGEGYTAIEIENIGSENITQVWFNATAPSTDPFGTGIASNYDSGNFVQLKPTGEITGVVSNDDYTFINRKEFNESNDLSYIFTPTGAGDWRYGRFRSASQEHFWTINATASSGGVCDGSDPDTVLRVGEKAHNKTHTGSNDFTDATEYTEYDITSLASSSYGLATNVWINSSKEGFTRQYDVLTYCSDSDTHTIRTRYNVKAGGASDLSFSGSAARHVLNASTNTEELQPGEHFNTDIGVSVPQGVPSGSGITGIIRVFVNAP